MSDEDLSGLIQRAQRGERSALEALIAQMAPAIRRFGLRMCKNDADADDVLQETLVQLVEALPSFEARSSLATWVFTLTRTACSRRRRGLKNQSHDSDELLKDRADMHATPEMQAASKQLAQALSKALDALSEEYREVLQLRDIEGLSAPEAAQVVGISVDALKSRLHRARESLRAELKPVLEPHVPRIETNCPDIVALWHHKLEGDLTQTDCAAMERHMEHCSSCKVACDALRQALVACQAVRSEVVPLNVHRRIQEALSASVAANLHASS